MTRHQRGTHLRARKGPETIVLATYSLQLLGPDRAQGPAHGTQFTDRLLRETEENLSDLLPPGFSVVIREWDEEEK